MRQPIAGLIAKTRTTCGIAVATVFLFVARAVSAVDTGLDVTANRAGLKTGQTDLPVIIGGFINDALALVGVVFLVLMIYGGFLWMTAAGNEEQVKKAKDLIVAAVIGVVVIFMAYSITYFVVSKVSTSALGTQ